MEWLRRHILLLFLLLMSLAVQAQTDTDSTSACRRAVEYYYLHSLSLLEQGCIDESFELLEHCRAMDSTSTAILYNLSPYYIVLKKDSIAHEMLERIVEASPQNEYYNTALVNYYNKKGDRKSAIAVYEKMLETAQSKSDVYMSLYNLYSEENDYAKALEVLNALERIEGKSLKISLDKHMQYVQSYDLDNAVSLVQQLIEENPDDVSFYLLLGETYVLFGKYAEAEAAFAEVLKVVPDDDSALASLVSLYSRLENDTAYCRSMEQLLKSERLETEDRVKNLLEYVVYKEATDTVYMRNFFKELMALPFDQVAITETYIKYLEYKNATGEEVWPLLERIVELEPDNKNAIISLLAYSIENNDAASVIKYADEALLYFPQNMLICFYKALAYGAMERFEECIEACRHALSVRTGDEELSAVSSVFGYLGDVYHEVGNMDKCIEVYDSALIYNPYNMSVLNNYAYFMALEGKELQKAHDMSYKTIEEEPENVTYLDTYAWILFLQERYEEARAYAEKIIQLKPEMDGVLYHHCGDIFAKSGDIDRAVEYWIKARESGVVDENLDKKIKKRKYSRAKKTK